VGTGGVTGRVAAGFTCIWCGAACQPAAPDDLGLLARLCADCLARAGDNPFLTRRLHAALEARVRMSPTTPDAAAAAGATAAPTTRPSAARALPLAALPVTGSAPGGGGGSDPGATSGPLPLPTGTSAATLASPATLAAPLVVPPDDPDLLDDWYLGRGRYDRGPVPGAVWLAELDAAVAWVDAAGLAGRIVEPRCGVGFWSVLLASAGELTALDDRPGMADRTTARLVAHGLRAHVHVADPTPPPGPDDAGVFDGAFLGFALSRLPPEPRGALVAATRSRLRLGGRLVLVDLGRPGIDDVHLRAALAEHLAGLRLLDAAAVGPDLIVAVAERDGA
jgi:hypothetical protein